MIIVMKVIDVSEYVVGFQISVKTEDFSESLCREALLLGWPVIFDAAFSLTLTANKQCLK